MKIANELLKKIEGGRIVSSGDLTELQILEAQRDKRFYVDSDGMGYAVLPWELTTAKDQQRATTVYLD